MSMTTSPEAGAGGLAGPGATVATVPSGWGTWRMVLLVWLGVVVVATLLTGTRPASLVELERELASGEVTAVRLVGELEPEAVGQAQVEVLWHDGLIARHTTVQQFRGATDGQLADDVPVVSTDLAGELARSTPTGELDVVSGPFRALCSTSVYGWCVPDGTALMTLAWGLVAFVTLVAGPEPRLATRWAWFWLLVGLGPAVLVAYLLVGLPRPGAPVRPPGRRLTGGWAFLIGLLLPGPGT